jgi:hypothetical protein
VHKVGDMRGAKGGALIVVFYDPLLFRLQAYETKVSQLIDKREDDASRIGLNGQPIQPPPYKKDKKAGNVGSLMDVDRYTMIRSRIW